VRAHAQRSASARRLAQNETLFREVNERIEDLARTHAGDEHVYEFLCECSNADCDLRLSLPLSRYEQARSDSAVFIVASGHDLPEIEDVILRGDGFQLVKKRGEAAELAAETDPRNEG
jgi:formate-nitrite transporter family protein